MSFKLFVYYCAICGGAAAFFGWGIGRVWAPRTPNAAFARTVFQALALGSAVALALGLLDAFWNLAPRQWLQITARAGVSLVIGCLGSLLGGALGQLLFGLTGWTAFIILGWTLIGLLIGMSVGMYDVLVRPLRGESLAGAGQKVVHGLLGGTLGGLVGGVLSVLLRTDWGLAQLFSKPEDQLKSPSAIGFVALGLFIGLFIGLAQIILKEAWITIEAGFKAGREMILSKTETVIGRAEGCDIGLFGDQSVERTHAKILLRENRYFLADAGSPGGTFLNEQRLTQPAALKSGDLIRVGQSLLRFGERQKKN